MKSSFSAPGYSCDQADNGAACFWQFLTDGDALFPEYKAPQFTAEQSAQLERKCSLYEILRDMDIEDFQPGKTDMRRNLAKEAGMRKTSASMTEMSIYSYNMEPLPAAIEGTGAPSVRMEDRLVLTVRVFEPTHVKSNKRLDRPRFSEEFKCLGSNYLTELRDKISCHCSDVSLVDVSAQPFATRPKQTTNPGFFFINDTFYNDTRNPLNSDYARHVLNWLVEPLHKHDGKQKLKTANMQQTRFVDLSAQIGVGYLYFHNAKCEHLLVISQLELLKPQSPCYAPMPYPYRTSTNAARRSYCHLCGKEPYAFVITESDRLPHECTFVCGFCFYNFNYANGKKIGHFKAFRIYDFDTALLHANTDYSVRFQNEIAQLITLPKNFDKIVLERTGKPIEKDELDSII